MRVAVSSNTKQRIGGQYLTRAQLTREFKKYEEVGILEQIAEAGAGEIEIGITNALMQGTVST